MTQYHFCCKCSNKAVWYYMPYSKNEIAANKYFCDTCVMRGCSCWWFSNIEYTYPQDGVLIIDDEIKIIKVDDGYKYVDMTMRELPCIEYDYCEEGFEIQVEE